MERLDLRLNRALAAGALALVLTVSVTGCRSTRSEVPPGRGYAPGTGQTPPLSFSNQPSNNALNGLPPAVGTGEPGSARFGTPAPSANPYGAPTANAYGPPGTSGLSTSSSLGAPGGAGLPPATSGLGASSGSPLTGSGPIGPGPTTDPAANPASAAPIPAQKPF
jgi:hypothetical protein